MKKLYLLPPLLLLVGCSQPATPSDIKETIKVCYGVRADVEKRLTEKPMNERAIWERGKEVEPLSQKELKEMLVHCINTRNNINSPKVQDSKKHLVKEQREAIGENLNPPVKEEKLDPKLKELLIFDLDNAP